MDTSDESADRLRADLERRLKAALAYVQHLRDLRAQLPDDSPRAEQIDRDLKAAEIDAGRLQAMLSSE
jgi:hypothetical protein